MSKFNWVCPYCERPQTIDYENTDEYRRSQLSIWDEGDNKYDLGLIAIRCCNYDCKKVMTRVNLLESKKRYGGYSQGDLVNPKLSKTYNLEPDSNSKSQPDYVPHFLVQDYKEACVIKNLSPKASASLCRRCLQGMIRDFFGISKGTLSEEITNIKDKCDPDVWESIDAIRKIGNIGAHMEKDVNLIIDVDSDEAQILIDLIEQLFEDWYVTRKKRQDRLSAANDLKDKKSKEKQSLIESQKLIENKNTSPEAA